jgi:nitroreductase
MNTRASLYQARYGSAEVTVPSAGSHLIDQLLAHRSVRAYLPDPVSDDTLTAIIAAAQSASSSSNLQAWSVVAVRDPERKARLAALAATRNTSARRLCFSYGWPIWPASSALPGRSAKPARRSITSRCSKSA